MLLRVGFHRFYSISVKSCHTDRRSHHDAVCQTMQFYLWSCSQHPAPALQLSGWGRVTHPAGQYSLRKHLPGKEGAARRPEHHRHPSPRDYPGLLYPRCRLCRRDDLPVHPEEIWQQCSRCHQATVCERGYRVCKLRQCSLEQAFAFSRRDIFCELCSSQRRCSGRWCLAGRC